MPRTLSIFPIASLLPLLWGAAFTGMPCAARTLHVSLSGSGADGLSWETAFPLIGNAIQQSASGDDIWVASGTYNESLTLKPGISLFGGFAGTELENEFEIRDWKANDTIIDAKGLNARCVRGASYTLVDGFSVCNAYLDGEFARSGGGFACARIIMTIRNCDIHHNFVGVDSIGIHHQGGGIAIISAFVDIESCVVRNNTALGGFGGGIFVFSIEAPACANIRNTLIYNNYGNGMDVIDASSRLEHCTFGLGNIAIYTDVEDDLRAFPPNQTMIRNCIVRTRIRNGIDAKYSNLLQFPGEGNIDEVPQWVDPENGDYRLKLDSPCIDSGTDTSLTNDLNGDPRPVDVRGIGIEGPRAYDMGAYEFQLSPADLDANGVADPLDLFIFQREWMKATH